MRIKADRHLKPVADHQQKVIAATVTHHERIVIRCLPLQLLLLPTADAKISLAVPVLEMENLLALQVGTPVLRRTILEASEMLTSPEIEPEKKSVIITIEQIAEAEPETIVMLLLLMAGKTEVVETVGRETVILL